MTDQPTAGTGEALLVRRSGLLQHLLVFWLISIFAISVVDISELAGLFVMEEIESTALAMTIMIIAVAVTVINIVVMIVFAMWIYRAAANVRDADVAGFEYTPGWAVGWYFIPFATWFKPFTAMRQIWNASRGATGHLDDGHSTLTIWWTFWIISSIANNVSLRMSFSAETPEALAVAIYFGLAGSIASIPLFFAARQLVTDITEGQAQGLHLGSTTPVGDALLY